MRSKYIFSITAQGSQTKGDRIIPVTISNTDIHVAWRLTGLQINGPVNRFSVCNANQEPISLEIIPWETCVRNSPLSIYLCNSSRERSKEPFATIEIKKTENKTEWKNFTIWNNIERYIVELEDLNDEFNRNVSCSTSPEQTFMRILTEKEKLESYYTNRQIHQDKYNITIDYWEQLLFGLSQKIITMTDINQDALIKVINFLTHYLQTHTIQKQSD